VRDSLRYQLKIGNAPGGGSDYAEGFKEALNVFDQTPGPNKQKVIVWFTDGGFTGEQAELQKVLAKVREANVRVIIVGVGSDTPQPIPVYDPNTRQKTGYLQQDGKTVTTSIDERNLTTLRDQIGAEYIRLEPGKKLDIHWASTLAGTHVEQRETDAYQLPLGLAMLLVFITFIRGIIPARRRTTR